jgi:hypothetical protein
MRTCIPPLIDTAKVYTCVKYKTPAPLWKDADPDIPILIAAKSEYEKLQ